MNNQTSSNQNSRPLHIGITGGFGSGKSTVASIFQKYGFTSIDADDLTHDLLQSPHIIQTLTQHFGPSILSNNSINRKILAELAFSSEPNLRFLENTIHPTLISQIKQTLKNHPNSDYVVQIPLLYEKKLENLFNFVLCVTCDDHIALARLQHRGFLPNEAQKRAQFQLPLEIKAKKADFVINNNLSLQDLNNNIYSLILKLKS